MNNNKKSINRRGGVQGILTGALDPIYTGLETMAQVLYLLEICCRGSVFIILYDEV